MLSERKNLVEKLILLVDIYLLAVGLLFLFYIIGIYNSSTKFLLEFLTLDSVFDSFSPLFFPSVMAIITLLTSLVVFARRKFINKQPVGKVIFLNLLFPIVIGGVLFMALAVSISRF